MSRKELPPGVFMSARGWPLGTTEQQIAEWFCHCGIAITEDHVSSADFDTCVSALVSVPQSEVAALISWALTRELYGDVKLSVRKATR